MRIVMSLKEDIRVFAKPRDKTCKIGELQIHREIEKGGSDNEMH